MAISLADAVEAASSRYPGNQWAYLDNAEQTREIYREMQRLDLAQARVAESTRQLTAGVETGN